MDNLIREDDRAVFADTDRRTGGRREIGVSFRRAGIGREVHACGHPLAAADRTGDQHDAFSIAAWMSRADRDGSLGDYLKPDLTPPERAIALVEGWILGVSGSSLAVLPRRLGRTPR